MSNAKPIIIGVAGASASGKTSICKHISKNIGITVGQNIPIVSQDWFYKELPEGANGNNHNWDDPQSFDIDEIISVLEQLQQGKDVYAPDHDYAKYKRIPNVHYISASNCIIIEGIFVLYEPRIRQLCDIHIYVDCEETTALGRRITRDITERHYEVNEIMKRYQEFVKPAYKKYIKPSKLFADTILMNNGDKGISSLLGVQLIEEYIRGRIC
jgi:uridine kinase